MNKNEAIVRVVAIAGLTVAGVTYFKLLEKFLAASKTSS